MGKHGNFGTSVCKAGEPKRLEFYSLIEILLLFIPDSYSQHFFVPCIGLS